LFGISKNSTKHEIIELFGERANIVGFVYHIGLHDEEKKISSSEIQIRFSFNDKNEVSDIEYIYKRW
jgi:hypothetical protein